MITLFFLSALLMLIMGVPIALTVGLSSIIYILLNDIQPMVIIQKLFSGVDMSALLAIPFFILAGDLMNSGGLAKRLVRFATAIVGRTTGGLAIVSILGCMFFAAISGSGVATAAALGSIMIPEMVKRGYSREFASSVVATASPMGVIIPPSISFIIYAVMTGTSISDLYKAGIPAGIMIGIALIIVAYVVSRKKGYAGNAEPFSAKSVWESFKDAAWALGTPVILIGGVFGGIFTPTESAVAAVVYALFVGGFIYRELKWRDIYNIFLQSARTSSQIMYIMANALLFAYVMTYERIPQAMVEGFMSLSDNPIIILLFINLILLFVGTFMETGAILIIMVPMFIPVITHLGIDPVLFGIIVTVNTAIGLTTPPFGVTLFTAGKVGNVGIEKISRQAILPIVAMIVALLIITYIPESVMFVLS